MPAKLSDRERAEERLRLYKIGLSCFHIAQIQGVCMVSVYRTLRQMGIKRPRCGQYTSYTDDPRPWADRGPFKTIWGDF